MVLSGDISDSFSLMIMIVARDALTRLEQTRPSFITHRRNTRGFCAACCEEVSYCAFVSSPSSVGEKSEVSVTCFFASGESVGISGTRGYIEACTVCEAATQALESPCGEDVQREETLPGCLIGI